ncbi:transposon Tf2-9 polyprotein [Trichonephila clavipes]|nr:transposon Tf2-9 polyprotein [Trichonephila clavipes]
MRFIHEVLRGLDYCWTTIFDYLDDILIASTDANFRKKHVKEVLQRLDDYGLTINASKCMFGCSEVPFVVRDLRKFWGILNFYRKFLPKAAHIQAPLHDFLKNSKKNDKREIQWNAEAINAFKQCKNQLANVAVLANPSQDADLALKTDTSDFGLGASLNEITSDGFKPLGCFFKKLTPAQTKYSAFDRELLAAYIPLSNKASPCQLRHFDFISQFTTDIKYVPGIDNVPVDAFSRISAIVTPSTIDYEEFAQMQQGDDELKTVLSATNQTLQLKQLRMPGSTTEIYCDIPTGTVRLYVPHAFRRNLFLAVHYLSHAGIRATTKLISKRFVWTSMNKDIRS